MKCITRYTINCMKEKQREHFNSLYTGTNKAIMELCHDGPYQDEFLKHAPCMQKVKAEYEMCYKKYQKTTMEMEKASNRSIGGTQEDLKSLCWMRSRSIAYPGKFGNAEVKLGTLKAQVNLT
ncbi:hypothetical protein RF55_3896 [Lasius niger]|uniref:Uncharacterized protein n=1 Tax=Lasius niger TaxID=67767 RepID=A0A0J7NTW9_LASNI|nr:hypothetical protein RF55_3896 [Lasius niger]